MQHFSSIPHLFFYDYFGFNNLQGNYLPQAQCETSRGVQSRRKADRDQ